MHDDKEIDKNIEELKQDLKNNPNDYEPNFAIGVLYCQKGEYDNAIKYLKKAIEIDSNNINGYCMIAEAYYSKGDYDKSIESCKSVIEKYKQNKDIIPPLSMIYNYIGLSYYNKKEYVKAIENFYKAKKQAIEERRKNNKSLIDPIGIYNNIGLAYYKKGQYDDVIKELEEGLKENYKSAETYNILANAYSQKGNFDKAIEIYLIAIKKIPSMNLDPNIICKLYSNLSIAYANKRDFDNAIINIKEAKKISKDYTTVYNVATEIYLLLKDYEEAFDNALKIEKNFNINPFFSIVNNLKNLFVNGQILGIYKKLLIEVYKLWDVLKIDIDSFKQENKDNCLYQYRTFDFLEVVLENKNFWLNPTDYQNDPNEGKAFFRYINSDREDTEIKNAKADLVAFISCFSASKDNLIMWNSSYAENGKGISVGVDIEKISNETDMQAGINILPSFLTEDQNKEFFENKKSIQIKKIGLYKILYINVNEEKIEETDKDKETKLLLKDIRELYKNIIEDTFYKNGDKEQKQRINNWLKDLFTLIRYLIKFDDYKHEKEYRLLYIDNIKNSKYVTTSTCWKGIHIETDKILFNDENKKDIVFIGPKNNSDIKKLKLEHYLKCTKLDKYIEIKPSDIEFR